ncbi:inositol-pentakisphosphate 2-kinase-like isoform X1 [Aphis gossypii]|uniref:inositol-pentakisphosphate 2-kinase-like isoform X1 n=1 Tax=Aphis gossypii TaxID=80765 RepID=UPI002158A807|nr:inositol-pentakisphosphate 2-kinase-like isoform X1 [Aphis gossypii]
MMEPAAVTRLLTCPEQLTLLDKEWRYKGEGNANVVLSLPADGTVVRVMKEADDCGEETATAVAETLLVRLRFFCAVKRLFFTDRRSVSPRSCHVDVPVPKRVAAEELREIDRLLGPDRPAGRKHKRLSRAAGLVAVCPDYTMLPPADEPSDVWCVEIKPKQGWVHEDDRRDTTRSTSAMCPFCVHQYLKLCRGDVRRPSAYCPLDMFSGCRERVRRAVGALLQDPQNNLKIFVDGQPLQVARDNGFLDAAKRVLGDVTRFCELVADALLDDSEPDDPSAADERDDDGDNDLHGFRSPSSLGCDFRSVPMPRHCVLNEILAMQRMQTTGFAAVCAEYDDDDCARDPHLQFGHVTRLRALHDGQAAVLSPVDGYLVAATARDCSVFVTFRPHSSRIFFPRTEVRVKVSDLDPKPRSTVEKHRIRNAEVASAYRQYSVG